jgi:hypothetical protein
LKNVRSIENVTDGQTIQDAYDKDADTCTMSFDGKSYDANDSRKLSYSDRYKESDRSNAANASGHQNDENADISDAVSELASIAMEMEDESDDDERIVLRREARNTMLSEQLTSDEEDDRVDEDEDVDGEGHRISE